MNNSNNDDGLRRSKDSKSAGGATSELGKLFTSLPLENSRMVLSSPTMTVNNKGESSGQLRKSSSRSEPCGFEGSKASTTLGSQQESHRKSMSFVPETRFSSENRSYLTPLEPESQYDRNADRRQQVFEKPSIPSTQSTNQHPSFVTWSDFKPWYIIKAEGNQEPIAYNNEKTASEAFDLGNLPFIELLENHSGTSYHIT